MSGTPLAYHADLITQFPLIHQGKVRDSFAIDDQHMLIVASDRLSAFDVVMAEPIPGKGEILTRISNFWFERTRDIVPNHLSGIEVADLIEDPELLQLLQHRAVVVKRLKPLPVEAVVRGYLIGSGWKDYQATGQVCGIALPAGLAQAQQLPEPIFTPATKAAVGDHDENISYAQAAELIGEDLAARVRDLSIRIYQEGAAYAAEYRTGISPPSFDKQYVRDYLETLAWNKEPPGPRLPADVIRHTSEKYHQALEQLTAPAG
jgi:phosphoribosylaminoimidazole-succinocarboxamide synthase